MYILIVISKNNEKLPNITTHDNIEKAMLKQNEITKAGEISYLYDIENGIAYYLRELGR